MTIDQFNIKTEKGVIDTNNQDLPQIESYAEFKDILKKTDINETLYNPVTDLNNVTIVQSASNNKNSPDTNVYAIQVTEGTANVMLGYVVGKNNIENWLSQYSENEIYDLKQEVQMQIDENQVIVSTQASLNSLQDMIMGFDITTPEGVKEFFRTAEDLSKDIQKDYDASLKVIRRELKTRANKNDKPTILEKNMLMLLEHKANVDLTNLKGIDVKLQNLKRDYKKDTNVDAFKENTASLYIKLGNYRKQGHALSQVLYSEQSLSNFTQNPPLNLNIPTRSNAEAKLTRDVYENMLGENIAINLFLLEADGKKITNDQNETLHDYMSAVMTGQKNGSKEKFIPSAALKSEALKVIALYPELASYIDTNAVAKTDIDFSGFGGGSFGGGGAGAEFKLDQNPEYIINHGTKRSGGLLDKLTPSQLTDFIDQQNFEPATKERLKTLSGLAIMVGAGFLAWKGISNIFKEKKDKNRGWYTAGAALLFGGAYISSGNILNFKNIGSDIGSLFSGSPDNITGNKENPTLEEETIGGITSMNIVFAGMNGLQIDAMLTPEDSNGNRKIDYDAAKAIIESTNNIANKSSRLQMIESLRNHKNQDLIPIALNAMGLSSDKLKNNPDKKYDDLIERGLDNLFKIIVEMKEKNYTRRNPEMKREIYDYMAGRNGMSFDKLASMGAFERDETLTDNDPLKNNINSLTTLTSQAEKDNLYRQSLKVYQELQYNNQYAGNFSFIEKGGVLYLQTYNRETVINANNRTMGNLPMYTTYQMIKAANLTNRIQDIFAGKSKVDKPFNISQVGGDIEFEKTKLTDIDGIKNLLQFFKDKVDTEVITAGRRGTLKEIAPSLEDQKQQYVNFLNAIPIRK